MEALKVWLFWGMIIFLVYQAYKNRKNMRMIVFKYSLVFFASTIISTPLITLYNVTHPHEAVLLAAELGYKGTRVMGKINAIDDTISDNTPRIMKKTYQTANKQYDVFIRPGHNMAAKTMNMYGAKKTVPKESMFMRWAKSLRYVLTLGTI